MYRLKAERPDLLIELNGGVRTLAQQLASSFLSRTSGDRTQFIDIPDIPVRIYIKETTTHE